MAIRVTVKLFSVLNSSPGAATQHVELPEGTRVFQLLDSLRLRNYADTKALVGWLLMVNKSRASLETVLKEGDELSIFDVP
ncbi:MAG TPA: MoaD/ThiS family protein, partial [Chloroflexota bacterium]|nr:MoaD/ThiS family protein [Chloroflexota bacterium]